jgi:hypothetical protein
MRLGWRESAVPACEAARTCRAGTYGVAFKDRPDLFARDFACARFPHYGVRRSEGSVPVTIQSIGMSWHCGKIVATRNCR